MCYAYLMECWVKFDEKVEWRNYSNRSVWCIMFKCKTGNEHTYLKNFVEICAFEGKFSFFFQRNRLWKFLSQIIEGFHVMSYQVNFASHHTRNCLVGFLSEQDGIGKNIKMFLYFLCRSYHITKLQLSDKIISTAHIHTRLKF